MPDLPVLEPNRPLDPVTAEHDRHTGRDPHYWRKRTYQGWPAKRKMLDRRLQGYPWQQQPCIVRARIDPGLSIEAYYRRQEAKGIFLPRPGPMISMMSTDAGVIPPLRPVSERTFTRVAVDLQGRSSRRAIKSPGRTGRSARHWARLQRCASSFLPRATAARTWFGAVPPIWSRALTEPSRVSTSKTSASICSLKRRSSSRTHLGEVLAAVYAVLHCVADDLVAVPEQQALAHR